MSGEVRPIRLRYSELKFYHQDIANTTFIMCPCIMKSISIKVEQIVESITSCKEGDYKENHLRKTNVHRLHS